MRLSLVLLLPLILAGTFLPGFPARAITLECGGEFEPESNPVSTLIVGLRGYEVSLRRQAESQGMIYVSSVTEDFVSGNTRVRLERSVNYRKVFLSLPNQMTSAQLMEALILSRTLHDEGASDIVLRPMKPGVPLTLVDGSGQTIKQVSLENLFTVAGAHSIRRALGQEFALQSVPPGKTRSSVASESRAYWMSLGLNELNAKLSMNTGIPVWQSSSELPRDSMVYLSYDGSSQVNETFPQLLGLIRRLKENGNEVTLVSPYLPYARSDRVDTAGHITIVGRLIADLLESQDLDRMVFVRLHAPQTQGFFRIPTLHLNENSTLKEHIKKLGATLLVAPDAGASKSVEAIAKELDIPLVSVEKKRDPLTGQTQMVGVSGLDLSAIDFENDVIVIMDDEIETGVASAASLNS